MTRLRALTFLAAAMMAACASGQDGLDALHADIAADYPSVAHVGAAEVPAEPLYLDIREPAEFAVSHLPGAVLVPPGTSVEALLDRIGVDTLKERDVVVYCSVGRRSSIYAQAAQDELMAAGARSVANLEGGIFGWHAERQPLEDAAGPTDLVHPYDAVWKRYVPRQDRTAFEPASR